MHRISEAGKQNFLMGYHREGDADPRIELLAIYNR
jgi:hypothetical protein